ncbi:hypothetical protein CANMA_004729 [Candida margitis]|uniref:uncharacterized protein n=1 Tax=Candida margitis TaxID=1775924 RepID=UPI002227CA40|nr:uncharacterized protein CANMA_004729 [Candida margitis]KAI5953890.1 hypothetical protein CANMA_004729 [Candida margitis]
MDSQKVGTHSTFQGNDHAINDTVVKKPQQDDPSSEDSLSSSQSNSDDDSYRDEGHGPDKATSSTFATAGQNPPSPKKAVESVTSVESLTAHLPTTRSASPKTADTSASNIVSTNPSVPTKTNLVTHPPQNQDAFDANNRHSHSTSPNESRSGSADPLKNLSRVQQQRTNEINKIFSRLSNATASNSQNVDNLLLEHQISILLKASPLDTEEYASHLNKLANILFEEKYDSKYTTSLHNKYQELINIVEQFVNFANPLKSQLYLIIEHNFEIMMKIATSYKSLEISTITIRFLTTVFMNLNYWELYNLLTWKPVIYHFLNLIGLDIHECYQKFLNDYEYYSYNKVKQPLALPRSRVRSRKRKIRKMIDDSDMTAEEKERTQRFFSLNPDTADHDKYVADIVSGANKQKRTFRPDVKLEHHKIIKKPINATALDRTPGKSSNYDPDVVHECQLPSAEIPHKLCLRRFSRKYELIRHQETVHSKKKKLFKCYVCVKQNPGVGPRIFTRHDTLAKHIRVNHEIFGKEAKAEVAYSKKHAEVVEEGDITVHVGRRKTKVDFELRAHMEKTGNECFGSYLETSDLESGDEEVVFNNPTPTPS